jgi:AcrR family transcriptional regulator
VTVRRSGTGPRKRLDGAARRETILTAAIGAFAETGYEQTRVSDIAALVGVTEPVVFQNFGTKADLFVAVLDRISEAGARQLAALGEESDDVLALLSRLMTAEHLDRIHGRSGLGMVFRDAATIREERIRDARQRGIARGVEALAAIVRRGQLEGSIRGDVDPPALAWLVLSLVSAREFRRVQSTRSSPTLERDLLAALARVLSGQADR